MVKQAARDLYVAVTHTSHSLDNTGIQRVTRCLCKALQEGYPAYNFVSWNEPLGLLGPIDKDQAEKLAAYCGPEDVEPRTDLRNAPGWISHLPIPRTYRRKVREAWRRQKAKFRFRNGGVIVIPEWVNGDEMKALVQFAKKKNLYSTAIFHDAIAIDHPELVSDKFRQNHFDYLQAMTLCDGIIANSRDSFERMKKFVAEDGIGNPIIDYEDLAGEIPGTARAEEPTKWGEELRALCVGSLDPRKNHKRLIEAFVRVWERRPDLNLTLTLIGGNYDETHPLGQWVGEMTRAHPNLESLGRVDESMLAQRYHDCHFTCFPSLVEGFGIPLLESIWKGRPCLTSSSGVLGELAEEGGCVTCDVEDVDSIASGILRMADDQETYKKLSLEAISRPVKTWAQFAEGFVDRVEGVIQQIRR